MTLQTKFSKGEFVILAEMNTPKGVDISDLVTNARHLKSRIDSVVIPDMDNGVMHMSALAGGSIIRQQGLEPMIHIYGRDRNRMAIQGDMLAAHVLGIHNLLVVQGDDIAHGDHQNAKPVDDLNELDLLAMVQSLLKGTDLAGFELQGKPEFFTGCQVQPIRDDSHLEEEFISAKAKVDAGAQYIMVPPVFDIAYYTQILNKFKSLNVPVIATIFMLKSVGMARYISINDPGSRLTESLISRIRKAKDRESECIHIAGEMIKALKGEAQGIKISASGWEDRLPAILDCEGL
ncbi:MAG: methylenetetrahydrofolate reductase [Desulfobacula sp.]|jgi:methylenetetrahydrofolate reductase (NADPH)|nr:methylenetetrahydrofolate reductase [Desulfobacula sp.]